VPPRNFREVCGLAYFLLTAAVIYQLWQLLPRS